MSTETIQHTEGTTLITTETPTNSFVQSVPGILVTAELEKALEECKARVARIAKECRVKNKKFRDVEFDLENDQYRCLHGLDFPVTGKYCPSDVQRVTQIFEQPRFFANGADSNDIIQGKLGDCWFLSALATISTAKGLVEKLCVARDEQVGVYGFIFFRDNAWVNVVVDDLLYTSVPKYEELSAVEKELYHEDKAQFNRSARKGGKTLYFAKSGATGETWVPLIEKAYAKLHGDYVSLSGGKACEAVEDLTGGVSTVMRNKDIFDTDRFWNEELLKANQDRLFGCSFESLDASRSGVHDAKVDGLIGSHAYSVLRAVECKGKRFVVLRNPWGNTEWTGKWSDGSKEWTSGWLEILPLLGHEFGNDGQFIMEYNDFLETWDQIHRTILFDSSWVMSSQWLRVPTRPLPSAWSFGDISFTFSLPKATFAIIVVSQLDLRYFKEISGTSMWGIDFVLARRGEKGPIAESSSSMLYSRSINLEMNLDAGEYVVYVRIDRTVFKEPDYFKKGVDSGWDHRKLSRVLTERAKSRSIASNFKPGQVVNKASSMNITNICLFLRIQATYIPTELSSLIDEDIKCFEAKKKEEALKKEKEENGTTTVTVTTVTTTTTTKTETMVKKGESSTGSITKKEATETGDHSFESGKPNAPALENLDACLFDPGHVAQSPITHTSTLSVPPPGDNSLPSNRIEIAEDENSVYLGLRVYTNKDTPVVVTGQLKVEIPQPNHPEPSSPY
ncbi:hypothetical protein BDZ94DRAFT_1310221 [Collybia nuda]|uniref:Calpain catalytic domain-containing protein n=1 Tax=Collybia nuda TaxID=64659 RepID=A0A9P5Y657_9AGAR|nr:hypothetical protein BDZ94DRAFT_1310221 [Collybia nuda]